MLFRPYISNEIHIDGRNIPYSIVTAYEYLLAKDIIQENEDENFHNEDGLEKWLKEKNENQHIYDRITQILAIKTSCFLLRRVSYSCQSLSDEMYQLKLELIRELKEKYNFEFDDEFVENFKYPFLNTI